MREMPRAPDSGFVVEWQLAETDSVLDLSMAESELVMPGDATADGELNLNSDIRGQVRR